MSPEPVSLINNQKPSLKSVRIRMCRQGLGDCFLLTFTNHLKQDFNLLIDCGVLTAPGGDGRLKMIVQALLAETKGCLDAVAITHEHADHISGFKEEDFTWKGPDGQDQVPQIGQLWMPWTENPKDKQVKEILKKVNAFSFAAMGAALAANPEERAQIQGVLLFQGIEFEPELPQGANENGDYGTTYHINVNMVNIMKSMRKRVSKPIYLSQRDVIPLPEFGLKFYCLGPSRDMPMLGGSGAVEPAMKLNRTNASLAAVTKFAEDNLTGAINILPKAKVKELKAETNELIELSQPFGREKMLKLSDIKKCSHSARASKYPEEIQKAAKFFNCVYGFGDEDSDSCPKWRRIDTDWMQSGGLIALQQVSIINNTSLVLAIELTDTGQVLLFCGDAEKENWQTWKNDHADIKDLLARTVVYKVGHHGSINATDPAMLKDQMKNEDLVALIPADVAVAHSMKSKNNPNGWQFPDPTLYNIKEKTGLLYSQTNGRIILNCKDKCKDCKPDYEKNKPWPGEIVDSEPDKLWVDYILHLDQALNH
jgi:hypothetical protein